jgi:hypothetical protein
MASVYQVLGKINPKLYAKNGKKLLKQYGSPENIPADEVEPQSLVMDDIKINIEHGAESKHQLTYESYSETLEPVYYFILDLMGDFGLKPEKLVDNFSPSPGSTQFSELGTRATAMQQQASQTMGNINTVLRSVLNIIYDLKDFQIRIQTYDDLKDPNKKDAAILSLKQIWMDKVDINKGNSSIKAMALGQAGFVTLIDAFLAVKDVKDITHGKIDLNERVKRILIPRIQEFNHWLVQSEQELRKRYQLERTYLRAQVNNLKLYSRWAKPYLMAAQQLEQKFSKDAALVKAFNRTLLELTIMGKTEAKPPKETLDMLGPRGQAKRPYYTCILVDFVFRAVPTQGNYIGKADVTFRGYALNEDEISKFKQEMESSDVGDVLRLIEGITDESLQQLQEDINYFLEGEPESPSEAEAPDESNPFLALLGFYGKKKAPKPKTSKKEEPIIVKPDTWIEKEHYRSIAASGAKEMAFNLFDIYKKAHGMPSYT